MYDPQFAWQLSLPQKRIPIPAASLFPIFDNPKVQLGTGSASLLLQSKERGEFINMFYEALRDDRKFQQREDFPGNLAKSPTQADEETLRRNKYCCLPKTDGERCMLCFLPHPTKGTAMYLYFRSGSVFELPKSMDYGFRGFHLFRGSIYDCEFIIKSPGHYVVQVFDCLAYGAMAIHQQSYSSRRIAMQDLMTNYSPAPNHPFYIEIKPTVTSEIAQRIIIEKRDDAGYTCDGIILQAWEMSYRPGQNNSCFKIKSDSHTTIDFFCLFNVSDSKGHWFDLYVEDTGKRRKQQWHFVTKTCLNATQLQKLHFVDPKHLHQKIVEASGDASGQWSIERVRWDKKRPNNLFTFQNTTRQQSDPRHWLAFVEAFERTEIPAWTLSNYRPLTPPPLPPSYRPSSPVYRPPSPVYRPPSPVYQPPSPVYQPPPSESPRQKKAKSN